MPQTIGKPAVHTKVAQLLLLNRQPLMDSPQWTWGCASRSVYLFSTGNAHSSCNATARTMFGVVCTAFAANDEQRQRRGVANLKERLATSEQLLQLTMNKDTRNK